MQIANGTTRYVPGVCVQPWSELPLWIPDKFNMEGMLTMSTEKALAAGLNVIDVTWFDEQNREMNDVEYTDWDIAAAVVNFTGLTKTWSA